MTYHLHDSTREDFVNWVNKRSRFSYENSNAMGSSSFWSTTVNMDASGFRFRTSHQSSGSREGTSGSVTWNNLLGASTTKDGLFANLHIHLVKPIVVIQNSWNGSPTTFQSTVLDLPIPFPTFAAALHAANLIDRLENRFR